MTSISHLFHKEHDILIGMIHLPPLLSLAGFPGMEQSIAKALADLSVLEQAGFDGALIENDNDLPHTEYANEAQIASFSIIAHEVCKQATIPIGVQMMLNDWRASFAIAKAVGAHFTRLDVFVDDVSSEWGEIHPNPTDIMAHKQLLYPELVLLTDIQVKYKTMLTPRPLTESAALAVQHGSDGLIITGEATGKETPLASLQEIREAYPEVPMFVGAGICEGNIKEQFTVANGGIVGSSIKSGDALGLDKALRLKQCLS